MSKHAPKPGALITAVGLVEQFDCEDACVVAVTASLCGADVHESSLTTATVPVVGSNRLAVIVTAIKS
jgi:hypothetical protein